MEEVKISATVYGLLISSLEVICLQTVAELCPTHDLCVKFDSTPAQMRRIIIWSSIKYGY